MKLTQQIRKTRTYVPPHTTASPTSQTSPQSTYVKSFYENCVEFCKSAVNYKSSKNNIDKKWIWKKRIAIAVCLYIIVEIGFILLYNFHNEIFNEHTGAYTTAAFVLGTVLFWPLIIIKNSRQFYNCYLDLKLLLRKGEIQEDSWYKKNAVAAYQLKSSINENGIISVIINILCILAVFIIYYLLLKQEIEINMFLKYTLYLIILISAIFTFLSKNNKNINIIFFVMCCGLSYYVYLLKFSTNPYIALVDESYILQSMTVAVVVVILFFIAGTSLYPMYQSFKMFFLSDFEDKIDYPITDISQSSMKLQSIKKYFLGLTMDSLLAYFQLFLSAYLLGLIKWESILTIIFFVIGSFIPLIMFLASNIFFTILCQKIYIKHIDFNGIDKEIDKEIEKFNSGSCNAGKVEMLISLKNMYSKELCTEVTINSPILAAMITPIVATILTIIFK